MKSVRNGIMCSTTFDRLTAYFDLPFELSLSPFLIRGSRTASTATACEESKIIVMDEQTAGLASNGDFEVVMPFAYFFAVDDG